MKKQTIILIIAFILILLINILSANADIYVGVVDGYVLNLTGHKMNGTHVTATVQGCSAGCSGTDTTDSNGYYVINNLNINSNDTIVANASWNNFYGNNTENADQYYTATINITMAEVPNPPTLEPINDTHNNSIITFNWTNYTDPQGLATYNVWIFNSVTYKNVSSPQNKTNVNFNLYTWYVKTCNAFGCSPWSSDTFNVSNLAPPTPSIPDINNTNNNTITFTWTSGGPDPDGDSTYFKFYIDGNITSGATSPKILSLSNGSHTWKVQECDSWMCSNWATDTFIIQNNAPSSPNLTLMNTTSATSKQFYWVSGIDPDGDTTYDEFQYENEAVVSPASSGLTQALSGTLLVHWRVRTCDTKGGCSSWVEDTFVKFTCPTTAPPTTPGGGGGGGGRPGGIIVPPKINCTEDWHCTDWTSCTPKGQQKRACTDWNKCGTKVYKPIEQRACTPAHCFNNKKDFSEERTDCGGRCKPCEVIYPAEIQYPYPIIGLNPINLVYLIIGFGLGIIILILIVIVLMKFSDHFNLFMKLKLVHWQISLGSKKHAFADYYNKVLPHYKRIEKELVQGWLSREIYRLNVKAKKRLSKLKIKKK